MASGFGYTGNRSRCFGFWQDFQKCYASADTPSQCVATKDDYLECLHHTKEVTRALQIKSQYLSKTSSELQTKRQEADQKADSGVLGLGLLRASNEASESSEARKAGKEAEKGGKEGKEE